MLCWQHKYLGTIAQVCVHSDLELLSTGWFQVPGVSQSVCCDWWEGAARPTSENSLCNLCSPVQYGNLLWAVPQLYLRSTATLLESQVLSQGVLSTGGTTLFQWSKFAGMNEFCKKTRAALGTNSIYRNLTNPALSVVLLACLIICSCKTMQPEWVIKQHGWLWYLVPELP